MTSEQIKALPTHQIVKVGAIEYYKTKDRLFKVGLSQDAVGMFPVFAFCGYLKPEEKDGS